MCDETPTGRPLPTLQQIRQANLHKIFEEQGAESPCDICGDPRHDYCNCTGKGFFESQDVRQDPGSERGFERQCQNCDVSHPGVYPCAWCEQPGHIAKDCMAHYADTSMQARFPKKEKIKRTPIKHYDCRHCGESHPFNIYCHKIRVPPVIPGECRSWWTTTQQHTSNCQYIAIKDNIGLCTYCQAQDHRYAACPQQIVDRESAVRDKKKNKKNHKKKGKIKIVAGFMTREQESDSTLSPEKEEMGVSMALPQRTKGEGFNAHFQDSGSVPQPAVSPRGTVCSFCGVDTHNDRDCPLMHQYIREQADALTQWRLQQYQQLQEWAEYEPPRQVPNYQGPLYRGGETY